MENHYCVYRHIRLDTMTPFYIGLGKDLKRPYFTWGRNKDWNNIVSTAGYRVDILFDDLTKEEAELKEREFILLYGRVDKGTGTLCNKNSGGAGGNKRIWTDEDRKKASIQSTGRKKSDEAKKRQSERLKGIKKSAQHVQKCLDNWAEKKRNGWVRNPESIKKQAESLRGRVVPIEESLKRSKKIEGSKPHPILKKKHPSKYYAYQLDPFTKEVIARFDGICQAARALDINSKNLQSCVDGKRRIAGGYAWRKELKVA